MWSTFQQPGDIIFVSSSGLGPFINRMAQRVITSEEAEPTHVMLCVVPGLYIHIGGTEHGPLRCLNHFRPAFNGCSFYSR